MLSKLKISLNRRKKNNEELNKPQKLSSDSRRVKFEERSKRFIIKSKLLKDISKDLMDNPKIIKNQEVKAEKLMAKAAISEVNSEKALLKSKEVQSKRAENLIIKSVLTRKKGEEVLLMANKETIDFDVENIKAKKEAHRLEIIIARINRKVEDLLSKSKHSKENKAIKLVDKAERLKIKSSEFSKKRKFITDGSSVNLKLQNKIDAVKYKGNRIIKSSINMKTKGELIQEDKVNQLVRKSREHKIEARLFRQRAIYMVEHPKAVERRILKSNKFIEKSEIAIERSMYVRRFGDVIRDMKDSHYSRVQNREAGTSKIRSNIIKWVGIFIILGCVAFFTLTFLKSTGFSFGDKWTDSSLSSHALFSGQHLRSGAGALQKNTMQLIITFFGGGALGLAGALLQKITKNRLAEVSILGIGSLNILFIYIYAMALKSEAFGTGIWGILMPVFLIIVSIIGTLFVWAVSRSRKANKNTFVIVGIAMQLLVEALSVIVVNPTKLNKASSTGGAQSEGKIIWDKIKGYTLGDVRNDIGNPKANAVDWWLIYLVIGIVVVVFAALFFIRRKIDAYETSEELASSTGVNVKRLRLVIYLLVALLAGAASSTLGTVALLGIIAPSVARLLFKNRFWPMATASFFIGGIMVALAAFLSLQVGWGLPVGILSTAIVIPYFLFLMVKEK